MIICRIAWINPTTEVESCYAIPVEYCYYTTTEGTHLIYLGVGNIVHIAAQIYKSQVQYNTTKQAAAARARADSKASTTGNLKHTTANYYFGLSWHGIIRSQLANGSDPQKI